MKTIIKLLIVLVFLNAAVRCGVVAWDYYQLKDAAQQAVVFGGGATPAQVREEIMKKAAELEVPLTEEGLDVRREGTRTYAIASYTQPVEYFPSKVYPVQLSFQVDALAVKPTTARDVLGETP